MCLDRKLIFFFPSSVYSETLLCYATSTCISPNSCGCCQYLQADTGKQFVLKAYSGCSLFQSPGWQGQSLDNSVVQWPILRWEGTWQRGLHPQESPSHRVSYLWSAQSTVSSTSDLSPAKYRDTWKREVVMASGITAGFCCISAK